jgi:hypothetical protein
MWGCNGGGGQAPAPAAAIPDPALDVCRKEVAARQQEATAAATRAASAEETSAKLAAEVAALQAENKTLKETPEQKAADLLKRSDEVASVEATDAVLTDIDQFLGVHLNSPVGKQVVGLRAKVVGKRKQLVAAEAKANAEKAIADIRSLLTEISDGDLDIKSLVIMGEYIKQKNLGFDAIAQLPRGTFAEATKDPDGERGKAFVVSGKVIQISKDGEYFRGLIGTGGYFSNDQLYHFVTPGTTRGVYEDRFATFAGIFTQRYEYQNRAGGSNEALVTVGYFKGQN